MDDFIRTDYCIRCRVSLRHYNCKRWCPFCRVLILLRCMGPQSLVVPDFLSFPASRSEFCCDTRNACIYCPEYPRVLSSIAPRGVFTRPVFSVGVVRDIPKRLYPFYESIASFGCCDCCWAVVALKSDQLNFFSGIGSRDVFAAFVAARLSFASFSASKFSARLSALST